jgi:hypothetical protein
MLLKADGVSPDIANEITVNEGNPLLFPDVTLKLKAARKQLALKKKYYTNSDQKNSKSSLPFKTYKKRDRFSGGIVPTGKADKIVCDYCGKPGHVEKDCHAKYPEKKKFFKKTKFNNYEK